MRSPASVWAAPLAVWAALLALLAANVGLAYAPVAGLPGVNLLVAAVMVVIIAVVFMQLGRASSLVRLAAVAGVLWASFLFVLVGADYLART